MAGLFLLILPPQFSQRSVLNIGFVDSGGGFGEYRFINHIKPGSQWGPSGSAWFDTSSHTNTWMKSIDSAGYPNVSIAVADNKNFGCSFAIPNSRNYGEVGSGHYYVLRWKGNGTVQLIPNSGSFTYQAGPVTGPSGSVSSSNVSVDSSSQWHTTSGSDTYIILNYTGPSQGINVNIKASGDSSTTNLTALEFYRLDDEPDRNLGKIFRTEYKQTLVDYCPSAIRFMDWVGGNNSRITRFDTTRTLPNAVLFGGGNQGSNFVASPPYGGMTFSTANQYTLASATGMPVADQHGELVIARVDTTAVRCGEFSISSITNPGSVGTVTTNAAHGFSNGDKIIHNFQVFVSFGNLVSGRNYFDSIDGTRVSVGAKVDSPGVPAGTLVTGLNLDGANTVRIGANATATLTGVGATFTPMPKLHQFPVTIAVTGSTTYTVGLDLSTYGTYPTGLTNNAYQFITLAVGGRTAAPVMFPGANFYAATFGAYMASGNYQTFIYDKTISFQTDGSGNRVFGAWMFDQGGSYGHNGGVPLEYCVALVNEVNAMGPAQPVGMWTNIPHLSLSSMDPDVTTAANWGVQALDVILNGSTVGGVTYAGLTASAKLFIEFSNETWNPTSGSLQNYYMWKRGFDRWPASGLTDGASLHSLRSTRVVSDIKATSNYTSNSGRIKFVMGGWGSQGVSAGTINPLRIDGTTYCLNDASYPYSSSTAPMVNHDLFAFAAYVSPEGSSFDATNLANYTASWISHFGNPTAQATDYSNYILGVTTVAAGGSETYENYLVHAAQYGTYVATYGKKACMYEGGWNENIFTVSNNGASEGNPILYQCATTSSNTSVVCTDATHLSIGQYIRGYGFQDFTKITNIVGNTLTVDKAPTVTMTYGQFFGFTDQNLYLHYTRRSAQWSTAQLSYFTSYSAIANCVMPSDYVQLALRWGHGYPDAYGFTGPTAWADLDPAWIAEGTRNRGLS